MNTKKNSKVLALLLAVAMVFVMSVPAFATNTGTANYTVKIYDAGDQASTVVDSSATSEITLTAGQDIYTAIDATLDFYDPLWTSYVDPINNQPTKFLDSFMGYASVNVDHSYNADGSGWSKDWGWRFTVNGVEPTFPNEPNHGMMMNQYIIQPGDEIVLKYVYTETSWDSSGNITSEVVYE